MTLILGISAFFHDSAATLIKDGEIISAAQEERFTRIKHDSNFPINAVKFILSNNKISLDDIDYVTFQDKTFIKFDRIIKSFISSSPDGFSSFKYAIPLWLKEKIFQKKILSNYLKKINKEFSKTKIMFSEHHAAHAASAFYPSPFEKAVIITIDGVGEWATTSIAFGNKNKIDIVNEINFPHSVGLLYSAFTSYLGFKVNSGEYKVMGLAPYGKPKYKDIILSNIIDLKKDGSFKLNLNYFDFITSNNMINKKFCDLFNNKKRISENEELTEFHMDIASSIQYVIEEIIIKITEYAFKKFNCENLCLAGGVALNCVANSKILQKNSFKNIWVQPAAGDAGGALGSSLLLWHNELNKQRKINKSDSMKGSYLGPDYEDNEIITTFEKIGANYKKLDFDNIIEEVTNKLDEGNVIGWFQGKMEYGPRALGNRSIIADPRNKDMQKKLNLKIKFRESFRPFAPAILYEDLEDWFDLKQPSPYMLLVSNILENKRINLQEQDENYFGIEKLNQLRSIVPSVTHIDFSSRIQTVHKDTNFKFYQLINKFKFKTGCPILVNTSFNIRGEPIVNNPEDAFNCFMGTNMDLLVIENFILSKQDQKIELIKDYKNRFELD